MAGVCHVIVADPDRNERARVAKIVLAAAKEVGDSVKVHQTEDGKGVLAVLADHRATLIVCEVLLEGVSGLSLLRSLREQAGSERASPIIFVTAMSRDSDRYWAMRNGAHAYIVKPYDSDQLHERVRGVLAADQGD